MRMKKIVIIDNYDSFTYNLVHLIEEIVLHEVDVKRNDDQDVLALEEYDYIILSPGPGIPEEAGKLKEIIAKYGPSKKIFGVCLGLQAIAEVYGASLKNLDRVFHGIQSEMKVTDKENIIFRNVPHQFQAGRYHSWVIDKESDTSELKVTATGEYDEIMAIQHKSYKVQAVQFHPESIMTPDGKTMLSNFLSQS